MNDKIVLGADIGGTHITAALVDIEKGELLSNSYIRRRVSSDQSAQKVVNTWCEVFEEIFQNFPLDSKKISMAMPGPFDYIKGISLMENQGKFDALYGLSIREMIANRLAINGENVRFVNDAGSFIGGEILGGVAKGYEKAIGITLGTGFGTGIFKNGKAADAGLWSAPFRNGIAEDYFSTRWFINRYKKLYGIQVAGVKEIMDAFNQNPLIQSIFDDFSNNLADFLISIILIEKLQIIVLGGNISNAFDVFYQSLEKALKLHQVEITIKKALLGEDAILIGAASVWQHNTIISSDK